MRGASNGLDLNILRYPLNYENQDQMDNTIASFMQTMFAGTRFESEINNIVTNTEFINCMMAFQLIFPTSMPTTREEKDACIQVANEGFETNPAFQTPFGQECKSVMKSLLCRLIEAPIMNTVVDCLNNTCDERGVGVNDREDLRNGLMTAVDAVANAAEPPANPEPPTENE